MSFFNWFLLRNQNWKIQFLRRVPYFFSETLNVHLQGGKPTMVLRYALKGVVQSKLWM